jgi:hypothetical protein
LRMKLPPTKALEATASASPTVLSEYPIPLSARAGRRGEQERARPEQEGASVKRSDEQAGRPRGVETGSGPPRVLRRGTQEPGDGQRCRARLGLLLASCRARSLFLLLAWSLGGGGYIAPAGCSAGRSLGRLVCSGSGKGNRGGGGGDGDRGGDAGASDLDG